MRAILDALPENLPCPVNDGKTAHLSGMMIPDIALKATRGNELRLRTEFQKPSVLFIYPRAGSPLEPNTNPELWDSIPGARGCTPQSCGFRDLQCEFSLLGVNIYGMSVQSPEVQDEFVMRNHISFPVLSDSDYVFTSALKLPTFDFAGERLIKRMALFVKDAIIQKVFYPVFPPDKNAHKVLAWLKEQL